MNQEKIGKFILKLRKEKKMTQKELADKLNVTDRAVSHWENGRRLPDVALYKPICEMFDITVNELLSGERLSKEESINKADENLIILTKEKSALYEAARWGHFTTTVLLLIYVVILAIKKGPEVATGSFVFLIMTLSGTVFWWIYLFKISKHK